MPRPWNILPYGRKVGTMTGWLWYFWIYSFLGCGLEKAFALATHAEHQVRRCFLMLPLCPVYGLGMVAVLALPEAVQRSGWLLLWGGLAATAVEYAVHWAYEAVLGVRFWDYSHVPGNLRGRVCLPFTLVWGLLTALAVWLVQPPLAALAARIPPGVTYAALLVFTADALCSAKALAALGTIDKRQTI